MYYDYYGIQRGWQAIIEGSLNLSKRAKILIWTWIVLMSIMPVYIVFSMIRDQFFYKDTIYHQTIELRYDINKGVREIKYSLDDIIDAQNDSIENCYCYY